MVNYRGFSLFKLRTEHVFAFSPHPSSTKELKKVYGLRLKQAVLSRMKYDKCYAVIKDEEVYAITGVGPDGMMWCVFSKLINGNKVGMIRASKVLIEFYHKDHSSLVCDIWDQNGDIAQWLAMLGFAPRFQYWHDDHCLIRFVRCQDESISGSTRLGRPVIS